MLRFCFVFLTIHFVIAEQIPEAHKLTIENLTREVELLRAELKAPADAIQWKIRADDHAKQVKHLSYKIQQLEASSRFMSHENCPISIFISDK